MLCVAMRSKKQKHNWGNDGNSIAWLIRANRNGMLLIGSYRHRLLSVETLPIFTCKQLVTIFKSRNLDLVIDIKVYQSRKTFFSLSNSEDRFELSAKWVGAVRSLDSKGGNGKAIGRWNCQPESVFQVGHTYDNTGSFRCGHMPGAGAAKRLLTQNSEHRLCLC